MEFKDRYTFNAKKDFIGKGGFARVYRAYDNIRKRTVALKFYHGQVSEKYDIISEINRMDDIVHPNLIRYYDADIIYSTNAFGEEQEMQIGILEYANAGDIGQFFQKKRELPIIHSIVLDILRGLQYLHTQGIAHRDLKPKNILLSKKGKQLTAKIADFGISKRLGVGSATMSSQLLGSIEYMAPEQFSPTKYAINNRLATNVDLWSFGVILHEILTQKLLFGSRTQGVSYEQILNNILFNNIPLDYSQIPKPFDQILQRCLVKKAVDRARHADELIEILTGRRSSNVSNLDIANEHLPTQDNPYQQPTTDNRPTIATQIESQTDTYTDEHYETQAVDQLDTEVTHPKHQKQHEKPNHLPTDQSESYETRILNKQKREISHSPTPISVPQKPASNRPIHSKSVQHEIAVGKNLFKLGNYPDSFAILDQYSNYEEFDTEAKFYLGFMYYNGKCGGAYDPAKGRKLMNEAKQADRSLVLRLTLKYVLNK